MLASTMGKMDYAIVVAYFALTFVVGFVSARRAKKQSSRGFFVAEKSLPWWVIGFTMVAASISAEQMLGEVGYAVQGGLAISNWDLGVFPALVLMIFIFLPLYLRSGVTTIPEYLEKRYGKTTRLLFAIYTVFNNACITLVMVLALGATALHNFLGIDLRWGAIILIAFTGFYTVYGGMLSVAWTQTLQCLLLLAGGLTLTAIGLSRVEGGWSGLFERMPDPHLIRPASDPYVPWPGLILLMLSTNVWYCCTNQFYVQSCLGAKSERHGRMGVLLTAFLAPVLTLCFAFPGYITGDLLAAGSRGRKPAVATASASQQADRDDVAAAEPALPPLPLDRDGEPDYDSAYPHLAKHLLGPGVRGFIIAAVIGAIMSSVAAIVNATASVFTNDLYQRWIRPDADGRRLVLVGRIVGLATLIVAYPLTLLAEQYTFIFTYSQNAWCILAIPIMLVFTFGALWRGATNRAATATFIFVAPFVAVPFIWRDGMVGLPFTDSRVHIFNFAFGLWIVAAVLMFAVSLLTRAPGGAAVARYVWSPSASRAAGEPGPRLPWYRTVGFWSLVAGAMFILIYLKYW